MLHPELRILTNLALRGRGIDDSGSSNDADDEKGGKREEDDASDDEYEVEVNAYPNNDYDVGSNRHDSD